MCIRDSELVHRGRPGLAGGRLDELGEPSRGGRVLVTQGLGAELVGERGRQQRGHTLVDLRAAQATEIEGFGVRGVHGAYLGPKGPWKRMPAPTERAARTSRKRTITPPNRTTGVGIRASPKCGGTVSPV